MLQLPGTPYLPLPLTLQSQHSDIQEQWLQQIINNRITISSSNNNNNYSSNINSLEDYLNLIYYQSILQDDVNNYMDVFEYTGKFIISNEIPWKLPNKYNKQQQQQWTLKDEITIILLNLIIYYNLRSGEIIYSILNQDETKETNTLWLNCFKLFKKSLEYINFLKQQSNLNNEIMEISAINIQLLECLIKSSIQLSFLSKTIWILQNNQFDIISNNSINYSTLSRLSIYIKDQLITMKSLSPNTQYFNPIIKYINAYQGVLLSIENYKQDKIGHAIGFLNYSIENIARKISIQEEDNKLKKKLIGFKNKVNKIDKKDKLKLNNSLLDSLSPLLQKDIKSLFQLINILNLKYQLDNNNLKFDKIPNHNDLLNEFIPSGREIPIDAKAWVPQFIEKNEQENERHGYY